MKPGNQFFDEDNSDDNEVANTDSIAKGVFVFKRKSSSVQQPSVSPKKKSRKKADKKGEISAPTHQSSESFFGLEKQILQNFRRDRYSNYRQLNQKLTQMMTDQQKDIFGRVMDDVIKFARSTYDNKHLTNDSTPGSIPTCVLLTGVNLPDHSDMFCLLKQNICLQVTPHVAAIKSVGCPNLKTLVLQTVKQLMKQDRSSEGEHFSDNQSDSEEEEENEDVGKRTKLQIGSFQKLKTWYQNQYTRPTGAQISGSTKIENPPPLAIILEDFESFPTQVLQNFIMNISMYSELPFVLIFGVATTIDAVHRTLPHSLTSILSMQKLTSEPSIEILDRFIRNVVINRDIPFKLGSKVLQILFENFAFCDLSVKNVLTTYQWCLLEHFSGRPTSLLCLVDKDKRRKIIMEEFSDKDLEAFMKLKSFKDLVMSNPNQFAPLLTDPIGFRDFLATRIEILWQRTETFNIFVGALHAMAVGLSKDTLGQRFYSVYCSCMCEPVTQCHEYRNTFGFIRVSEKNDLVKRMKAFVNYLEEFSVTNEDAKKAVEDGTSLLNELENFEKQKPGTKESPRKSAPVDSASRSSPRKQSSPPSTPTTTTTPKPNRFQYQQKLLQEAKEKHTEEAAKNPFIKMRQKVIKFWHQTFEDHLGSGPKTCLPSKQVFHEIQYFDDVALMREHLVGNPRDALQTALQDPNYYLEHSDLKLDSLTDITASLPDVTIAYKLHLECQRFINLFDWYQCWLSIVTSEENVTNDQANRKKSKKSNGDSAETEDGKLQARFSRAVSELQFLGFIRSSKRKTDHVERLALNS